MWGWEPGEGRKCTWGDSGRGKMENVRVGDIEIRDVVCVYREAVRGGKVEKREAKGQKIMRRGGEICWTSEEEARRMGKGEERGWTIREHVRG